MVEPIMASKVHDIIAEIAAGLASPRVVTAIDKAITEFQQGQLSLLELRKAAVRLHGETPSAPTTPNTPSASAIKAPSAPQISQKSESQAFDGTVMDLVRCYRNDERSPYHNLRYKTRENYNSLIKRITEDCGRDKLADWKARDIQRLYDGWTASGKLSMGHSLVTMIRALINFGATKLEDSECERLTVILHNMNFPMVKRRGGERLTVEQAIAIIGKAREIGVHSIALAQAFQLDCMLRQKDVIGEWVPQSEPGVSDVVHGDEKWLHGLRWSEIDEDLILRHTTSRGDKEIEVDLKLAPKVIEQLERMGRKASGPVIVYEATKRPYHGPQFRRIWREVADAAGVPKHVKNMDSRVSAGSDEGSSVVETTESAR